MDEKLFRSLEWRNIGPHRGGRVVAVAGHPTEQGTFYFGGCAGGVWKTTSAGVLWENVSDGFFNTSAIGALAVAPSAPEVIYAGTGESTIRGNVSHGDGVYKSTDGGRTWRNIGLAETRHIGDIVIHPTNPDIVYVAALGHAWGHNETRGVFRTLDGGKNWQKVLYKSDRAGATDLAMDPNHPEILFANLWQVQRYPHAMHSGGEDSSLWKSTDSGETWSEITTAKGLPKGPLGKIGVAASPAQAGRVWAIIEAADEKGADTGGIFRSEDWGATWERTNGELDLRRRPWYYMHIFADPQDAETVWVLNLQCWKSTDGGKTFTAIPTAHGDNHGLWIDPRDSNRLIESNDGGAIVSLDGGRTWSPVDNQPTAQFYHVTTDDHVPYRVYGSQQDNFALRVPSADFEGAISWKSITDPGGGESGYIAISPKPPHYVFGGGIGTGPGHGRLVRWNPENGHKRNVTVWPEVHGSGAGGVGAERLKYRFQWTYPVEFSPHDPDALYICSNHVHRSRDLGTSWEEVSPDLTRNDPTKLVSSGGLITADNSGAEIYCTIFAFRESPHEAGVFWAGSDDGLVQLSRDGGANWRNVTPPDLPEWALISIIEPSPHDAATAYIAATRYKHDDLAPYLFKTNDYGATWQRITNGIPPTDFTRVIREDPNKRGLLYAGTETGLYVSFDDGANWQRFQGNLPVAPIHDLVVKGSDLVVATHGRAFWILDDLTPLYQMTDGAVHEKATLFAPRPAPRYRTYERAWGDQLAGYTSYMATGPLSVAYRPVERPDGTKTRQVLNAGKNPPFGVVIHYTLAEPPEGEVKLEILDFDGNLIRGYSSKSEDAPKVAAEAGANRFVWDLRYPKATALEESGEKAKKPDPYKKMMEEAVAPRAMPGDYQVRLTVGETVLTQPFTVQPDPRLSVTHEELQQQFELKLAIRDQLSELNQSINTIRRLRKQLDGWVERTKEHERGASLKEQAEAIKEKLRTLEDALINTREDHPVPGEGGLRDKLATLSTMIDESDDAPTRGAREVYAQLAERAGAERAKLDALLAEDVAAINRSIGELGLPAVGA